jgi:hypothetical protein
MMNKAINIIGGLAILWVILHGIWNIGNFEGFSGDLQGVVILHGIWNIGNFEGFSGDLQGVQLFEGIFALTVGIALLSIFLKIRRR